MKEQAYRTWLQEQKYEAATINAQMHRAGRVEKHCGDLDDHYTKDRMASLIEILRYSTEDERRNRPNPTPIPFEGNIRNNLASYRNAAERYRKFRDLEADSSSDIPATVRAEAVVADETGQRIGLERDLQVALRMHIDTLESGLTIIDEGAERSVNSGFIDITARDAAGVVVVIELKAGTAGQRAIAQILSYMGDIVAEEESGSVRGILVASDFDEKAKAAARMVPSLSLRNYSVRFTFTEPS